MEMLLPTKSEISAFSGTVRRYGWLVLLLFLTGVGGAAALAAWQPRVYESTTSVLVEPVGAGPDRGTADGSASDPGTGPQINLDTEAQLVRSTAVAAAAAGELGVATPAGQLTTAVTVSTPATSSVLMITYTAETAQGARAGSHAFARAYLQNRRDLATAEVAAQLSAVNDRVQQLKSQLAQLNTQIATNAGTTAARANLESLRATTTSEINAMTVRANQLATATVNPGRIIRDADTPAGPVRPQVPLTLACGGLAGALLGVAAALLGQRHGRRVRDGRDLSRRTGLRVLAGLTPSAGLPLDEVLDPAGPAGPIIGRLRNEVLASLDARPGGQVVVVASAGPGPGAALVAANLATALARTGSETVLVSAHLPATPGEVPLAPRLLGVWPAPGLADILAGRIEPIGAGRRVPDLRSLRVITTGRTGNAAAVLQSHALRGVLETLRQRAEYVVIEAPSTSSSADAQSLARLADVALIVVERNRTRYSQVNDAVEQLGGVHTAVLGAVVLPRLCGREELVPDRRVGAAPGVPGAGGPTPDGAGADLDSSEALPANGARTDAGRRPAIDEAPTIVLSRPALDEIQRRRPEHEPERHTPAQVRPEHEAERQEPTQHEPAQHEPAQQEPAQHEPAQHEPARHHSGRQEPGQHQPGQHRPDPQLPGQTQPRGASIGGVVGNGRSGVVGSGTGRMERGDRRAGPVLRDATALLAALTEDGPLDGAR